MSENTVAIRCKSEMNRWMDSVMVVPQEQADDIEQSIKERMRGFERNGSCYGDVMREIAQAAGIESLALCDYDEDTDEPTDAWCEYCAGLSQKMPVIEIDLGELGNDVNIDDLLDKAEELGWCVRESDTEWEFIQNSPPVKISLSTSARATSATRTTWCARFVPMRMASTLRNTPRCGLRHRDGCPVSLTSRRL